MQHILNFLRCTGDKKIFYIRYFIILSEFPLVTYGFRRTHARTHTRAHTHTHTVAFPHLMHLCQLLKLCSMLRERDRQTHLMTRTLVTIEEWAEWADGLPLAPSTAG